MRCKDIERLIIDSSEGNLSQEERCAIEQHVAQCAECARFQDDLKNIRVSIKEMPAPTLPAELESQIRLLCHDKLSSRLASDKWLDSQARSASVPWVIWAALTSLIVLTAFILFSSFKEVGLNQHLSYESVFVLTLMLQNAVMLFFAPIVIRKYRSRKQSFRLI